MKSNAKSIIIYSTLIILGLSVFFWGLVKAKVFLAPLSIAVLLAMIILPVCRWFQAKGISRGWASFLSDLVIMLFFVALAWVVGIQINSFMEDWPKIKERIAPKVEQLQEFVSEKTGLSLQKQIPGSFLQQNGQSQSNTSPEQGQEQQGQQEGEEGQQQGQGEEGQGQQQQQQQQQQTGQSGKGGGGSMASTAGSFLMQLVSFMGTFLLVFVYIFFFLLYRRKFKNSMLKFVPKEKRDIARDVLNKSMYTAQNYLFGRLILIFFLAVIYSVGLSISGVKNAVLISILAAVLSLIPYVGNIIGYVLAMAMAGFSGSGAAGFIGVTITFSVAQFVESYILEPYIVGDKVNLNPVMVIIVVVLGEVVWGVLGMLIAIPALGIAKVIFDHVPVLHPLGYLFGEEDIGDEEEKDNIFTKTKKWALRKFK